MSLRSTNDRTVGVTLAVCTHNGSSRLEKTIAHILDQDAPKEIYWELLVVDNVSTDKTAEVIRHLWPDEISDKLRIVREDRIGALYARERAVKEARYSYLSYIDDDNWISQNWIFEIHQIFERYQQVGIISCPSSANFRSTPPVYLTDLQGWLAIGTKCTEEGIVTTRPSSFWTAGLSLRLEAFNALAGSSYAACLTGRTGSRTLGGEDHELCLTLTLLGWEIYYTHEISFVHDIPPNRLTVSYLEKLIQNGGKSRAILDVYRNEYRQFPLYHPYLSIISYCFYFCERALKYWTKKALGQANSPLNPNRTSYLHAIGRLQSYFIHFKLIAQARQNIKLLKSLKPALEQMDTA